MKWTPADKRRRWFGLFYLLTAIGMLVWGQTILKPHLTGFTFIFYWLSCFGMTLLAMIVAMLDIWVIRLRQRHTENEAAKKVLDRSAQKKSHERSDQKSKS